MLQSNCIMHATDLCRHLPQLLKSDIGTLIPLVKNCKVLHFSLIVIHMAESPRCSSEWLAFYPKVGSGGTFSLRIPSRWKLLQGSTDDLNMQKVPDSTTGSCNSVSQRAGDANQNRQSCSRWTGFLVWCKGALYLCNIAGYICAGNGTANAHLSSFP